MRLCGVGIPFEHSFAEKSAANRIHKSSKSISDNPLGYDGPDIAGTLLGAQEDGKGILRAIEEGNPTDLEGRVIDSETIKEELAALAEDLTKIEGVVRKTLDSNEGRARWGRDVVDLHGTQVSLSKCASELLSLAEKMNGLIVN